MKRVITLNGRRKGTTEHCGQIGTEIDAISDKDAFKQIHEKYEHVVWAKFENGDRLDREGLVDWAEEEAGPRPDPYFEESDLL